MPRYFANMGMLLYKYVHTSQDNAIEGLFMLNDINWMATE